MDALYVDALNFARSFFPPREPWDLGQSFQRVQNFVSAAEHTNIEVSVFIDASIQSEEGKEKWFKRREEEVRKMERSVPQGLQTLLGDMFQELGVKVYFSVDSDLDDALAFFAQADGASILSSDNDFWRYDNATYRLFKDFRISRGLLKLVPHDGHLKPGVERRAIGPKPKMEDNCPSFIDVRRTGEYVRGAPSPLVKLLGNPHRWVRPLRQALYLRFGLSSVREVFPSWDSVANQVAWCNDQVDPDDSMGHLLEAPLQAIHELAPELHEQVPDGVSDEQRWKHVFAVHAVVHELCCAASGSSFFRAMMNDKGLVAAAVPARRVKGKVKGKRKSSGKGPYEGQGKGKQPAMAKGSKKGYGKTKKGKGLDAK